MCPSLLSAFQMVPSEPLNDSKPPQILPKMRPKGFQFSDEHKDDADYIDGYNKYCSTSPAAPLLDPPSSTGLVGRREAT